MSKPATEEVFHPIEAASKRKRIPITEIARRAKIRRVLLHQVIAWEEGRYLTPEQWGRVARVLGVTVAYLQGPKRRLLDEPVALKPSDTTR